MSSVNASRPWTWKGRSTRYRYDALGRLFEVRQYIDQTLAASDTDLQLTAHC